MPNELLAPGHNEAWLAKRTLNGLGTGIEQTKSSLKKQGLLDSEDYNRV